MGDIAELSEDEAMRWNAWLDAAQKAFDRMPPHLRPKSMGLGSKLEEELVPSFHTDNTFWEDVEAARAEALPLGDHFAEVYGIEPE